MIITPKPATPRYRQLPIHLADRLIDLHDRLYSGPNKALLKHWVLRVSIAVFLLHLALICISRALPAYPLLAAAVGGNYLAAISTPFNIILFYEVLTLIAALPASTTRSIANQFEIVSLIFIRDVFKSIAAVTGPHWLHQHLREAWPLFYDMCTGLLLFALVAVFQHVALRQVQMPSSLRYQQAKERFEQRKKMIAVGLTCLLLCLAAYHVVSLAITTFQAQTAAQIAQIQPADFFYNDVFTVMIFTDVLVLIFSLLLTGRYEMVFRNAAYVLSIILMRFSLTESRPWGGALALFAVVFATLTSLLFNYHSKLRLLDVAEHTT